MATPMKDGSCILHTHGCVSCKLHRSWNWSAGYFYNMITITKIHYLLENCVHFPEVLATDTWQPFPVWVLLVKWQKAKRRCKVPASRVRGCPRLKLAHFYGLTFMTSHPGQGNPSPGETLSGSRTYVLSSRWTLFMTKYATSILVTIIATLGVLWASRQDHRTPSAGLRLL